MGLHQIPICHGASACNGCRRTGRAWNKRDECGGAAPGILLTGSGKVVDPHVLRQQSAATFIAVLFFILLFIPLFGFALSLLVLFSLFAAGIVFALCIAPLFLSLLLA